MSSRDSSPETFTRNGSHPSSRTVRGRASPPARTFTSRHTVASRVTSPARVSTPPSSEVAAAAIFPLDARADRPESVPRRLRVGNAAPPPNETRRLRRRSSRRSHTLAPSSSLDPRGRIPCVRTPPRRARRDRASPSPRPGHDVSGSPNARVTHAKFRSPPTVTTDAPPGAPSHSDASCTAGSRWGA